MFALDSVAIAPQRRERRVLVKRGKGMRMLAEDLRLSRGVIWFSDSDPQEDDDVLDQWLVSLTLEELEHILDGLAVMGRTR